VKIGKNAGLLINEVGERRQELGLGSFFEETISGMESISMLQLEENVRLFL